MIIRMISCPGDEVPLPPERFDAVGVLDFSLPAPRRGRRWFDLGRGRFDLACSGQERSPALGACAIASLE